MTLGTNLNEALPDQGAWSWGKKGLNKHRRGCYILSLDSVATDWCFVAKSSIWAKQINPSCSASCLKAGWRWLRASLIPPGSARLPELEICGTKQPLGAASHSQSSSKVGEGASSSAVCTMRRVTGRWGSCLL